MFTDKLKSLINKQKETEEGNDKKKIENLVFFIIILIITIVIINIIWNGNKTSKKENTDEIDDKRLATNIENNITTTSYIDTSSNDLEKKLEMILAKIQGVGEVNVFISYSESSEIVAMYNENSKISNTEEADTSGGTRKIQETDIQKDIIYKEDSSRRKNSNNTKNNTAKSTRSNNNSKRSIRCISKNQHNTSSRSSNRFSHTQNTSI